MESKCKARSKNKKEDSSYRHGDKSPRVRFKTSKKSRKTRAYTVRLDSESDQDESLLESLDGVYTGTGDKDESVNFAYTVPPIYNPFKSTDLPHSKPRCEDSDVSPDSNFRNVRNLELSVQSDHASLDTARQSRSAYTAQERTNNIWIGDTGATSHMTDQLNLFVEDLRLKESGRRKVNVGGGQLSILERGTARFRPSNARLHNVLYVPRLGVNLISISKLCTNNYKGEFNHNSIKI